MKHIKKGKITLTIVIGIACIALTTVMFMQFKMVNQTDIDELEVMREEELRTELAEWKNKYEEAENQYNSQLAKLEEYNQKEESETETAELVQKELDEVNLLLGKTDVEGQGIIITLKENSDAESGIITSDNLNMIVNNLKEAGAEAISINEQRIVNMSDIVTVNDVIIRVNQQRILTPYIIKAIGNQSYLESAMSGNGSEADKLQKLGHDIKIEKDNKVQIPKYDKDLKSDYIE